MDFKIKLINQIIHILTPLRNLYKEEIDVISNDLLNSNYKSLEIFVDKYYKEISYSKELKELVTILVNNNKLSNNYLEFFSNSNIFEYKKINLNNKSILTGYRPLNVKQDKLLLIKNAINKKESKEVNENIQKIKQSLIDAQLNYLKNANQFVLNLENQNEDKIYNSLLNLGDIRYIHHCISKLKIDTLKRFLIYMDNKLLKNNHNSIDIFIKEAIKLHIRNE